MSSVSNKVEHLTEMYFVRVLKMFRRDVNTYLVFSEEETLAANYKAFNMLIYCVN